MTALKHHRQSEIIPVCTPEFEIPDTGCVRNIADLFEIPPVR